MAYVVRYDRPIQQRVFPKSDVWPRLFAISLISTKRRRL